MDRIETLKTFGRVVETGSLSAAAAALGISLASVSRHLSALERSLGACLVERTTRTLAVTEVGRAYYDRIKRILSDLEEADMEVGHERAVATGSLTVSAPLLLGRLHLAPVIRTFLAGQPQVRVCLSLTDRYADLKAEGVDVAVRIGDLRNANLVARQVASFRRVLCASPQYLERYGMPLSPRDLIDHECLPCTLFAGADEWHLEQDGEESAVLINGRFKSDSLDATIEAAEHGLGIALVAPWAISEHVRTRRLRYVLPEWRQQTTRVHAVFPFARRHSAKTRAFIEHVAFAWSVEEFDALEASAAVSALLRAEPQAERIRAIDS